MHELVIEGVIGDWWDGVTSQKVRDELKGKTGDLSVYINSPGGSAWDGTSIYNQLRRYDGAVNVFIEGVAASAASVIAMAGDSVTMMRGSTFMVHKPWTVTIGNDEDHQKATELLGNAFESIIEAYMVRADMDESKVRDWVEQETWFTAQETVDAGFADTIEGEAKEYTIPENLYHNAPAALVKGKPIDDKETEAKVWRAISMGMAAEVLKRRA